MAHFLTPSKKMTAGEERFANLLKQHLDDNYLVWFDIPTNAKIQRFPDFLIFNPNYGLWCIEIKDWAFGNLRKLSPDYVILKQGENEKKYANPIMQARDCLLPVINQLNQDKILLQSEGKHQGKLAFPWGFAAVVSQWKRESVNEKIADKFHQCFPKKQLFFKNDIDENLISKEDFIEKLHGVLPYRFGELSKAQADKVRAHIFPEFIIEQKSLFENDESMRLPDIVTIMDNSQETLARSLGGGHRVIHGVAGSGKTILLEHRAKVLAEQNSNKEILVICFNVVLANRLRQRLSNDNITVMHFHGWCKAMCEKFDLTVAEGVAFQQQPKAACEAVADGTIPQGIYHAVLIDEGHDFAPEWLTAMSQLPDVTDDQLMLLYDDAQSIYDNNKGIAFTLSSVGIKAPGRTTILRTNYRNSYEILSAAERFLLNFLDTHEPQDDEDDIPLLAMQAGGKQTDEYPIFQSYKDVDKEYAGIISQVASWQKTGIRLGDIAILSKATEFAKNLKKKLIDADIKVNSAINSNDKKSYQPQVDALTLCCIASSKGSEFSHVILAGLGDCKEKESDKRKEARLIYVGMTRAQNALFMTASKDNVFTGVLTDGEFQIAN